MSALPSATIIAVVTPGTSFSSSATPSFLRSSSCSASIFSRYSRARACSSAGGLLVEALDRGELVALDEGDFLDAGEAFRGEQLRHHLVDVERRR